MIDRLLGSIEVLSRRAEKYPYNVIVKYIDHQKNEDEDTDLLGNFTHLYADRTTDRSFDEEEKKVSPV
jgi:hypothetical protein